MAAPGMTAHLVTFVVTGALVAAAGAALARHGDALGDRTRMGKLWIGAVLLAAATSLPELVTDVSAVRLGAPDLAVGDLFGSSLANMLILAAVDLLPPRVGLLRRIALEHALAAGVAILLTTLAATFILVRFAPMLGGVSVGALVLLAVYLAGIRAIYRNVPPTANPALTNAEDGGPSLRAAVVGLAAAALVILLAAPHLAGSAVALAEDTGLGATFFGTVLVGLATSLPELATSISAVRLRAYDLAIGNLFGSNAFNMVIILALDVAHPGGSIFAAIDPAHAISATLATAVMALGLGAIVFRAERRLALIEPDSLLIVVGYALAIWLLFHYTQGLTP